MLLLAALAILPGLLIVGYIYRMDSYDKEPKRLLLTCFILGIISTIPAIWLEQFGMEMGLDISENILITAIFAFVVVGGSEELVKFIPLRFYAYPKKAFNEPLDGIVYSVMISMGFATLENVFYVMEGGAQTALLRMFTAVPAHGAFAIIMGYFIGLAKFSEPQYRMGLLWKGFLGAVFLHGAYDFFLFQQNVPALSLLAFVALYLGIRYSRKLIKMHQQISPFQDAREPDNFVYEELENDPEFQVGLDEEEAI
ncbi:MAG: PrsW family glutamic-type intramembrane protease [Bacteroidota bacterium]